jgi:hypothetical protein
VIKHFAFLCALCALCGESRAADPCKSGLEIGQRPGPYTFVIATGLQRGQSYCYICETADRPAVAVFARKPSDALGKLVNRIDQAVADHKKADLRAWVTFVSKDQLTLDAELLKWGPQHAIKSTPLGVFEDPDGPPAYRLGKDAEVTVIFFVKRKVTANFAFRAGELNDEATAEVMKALAGVVGK